MSRPPPANERRPLEAAPPSLRGLTTAAPLKRRSRVATHARCATSPRSNDRGPIEAQKIAATEGAALVGSPRSNDRGPIEAVRLGRQPQHLVDSPRSND